MNLQGVSRIPPPNNIIERTIQDKEMTHDMITRFTCSNFKNVDVDKMELGKVNLLIGPNNAGKSNFIRALSFAANMTSVSSNEDSGFLTEIRRNGSIEILRHGYKDSPVHLNWRILLGGRAAEYTLDFCFDEELNAFKIVNESLDSGEALHGKERAFNYFRFHDMNPGFGMFSTAYQIGDTNNKRIHVPARVDETGLRQFDKLVISNKNLLKNDYIRETMFTMLEELRSYFLKFYSYGSSQFDFEKVRQLQEPTAKDSRLTKDGSNFLSVYQYAKAVDSDFEERFLNKMQELIIDLKDIRIVEGLDKIGMKLFMCKSEYMLSEVSDGTIEALLLAILTSLPKEMAPTLLAIDEPEVNLHPAWQNILAKWLQTCGGFSQCFISTHSSDFLDAFTEGFKTGLVNIFVYDSAGKSTFKPLDRKRINIELEKGWLLGDLYRVNDPSMGGWPW